MSSGPVNSEASAPEIIDVWPDSAELHGGIGIEEVIPHLRSLRSDGRLPRAIEIRIHGGRYELDRTLEFGPGDLGTTSTPIVISAAGDGEVVLSGNRRLTGIVREDGVAVFALEAEPVRHAYVDADRMQAARFPSYDPEDPYFGGWLYADAPPAGVEPTRDRFWCRHERFSNYSEMIGAEVNVFPRWGYRNSQRQIVGFDPSSGEINIDPPASYEIDPGDRFFIHHLADELTESGEWVHDVERNQIRFLPVIAVKSGDVVDLEIPVLSHLVHIHGTAVPVAALEVDTWAYWDDVIRHLPPPETVTCGYLTFRGITFEGCSGTAVQIENVQQCQVIASTIRNTGGRGIEIIGGSRCFVTDCEVSGTSHDGVLVAAGVHKPFNVIDIPARHRIENCYVHHIGLDEKHVAGVSLAGVGNELAHCLIHDCPRWGILSRGSHQLIEYNHVRHVNIETADTAGIYTCDRDLTMMGSIIRYNRVHDILGYEKTDDGWRFPSYAFGIYLDDWTSHVTVHGNLTYNTPRGGIYLNSGQANTVTNNCCLAGRRELAYYNRWSDEQEQDRIGTYGQGLRRNRIERNIFLGNGESEVLYAFGRNLSESGEVDIESNVWARNVVWNSDRPIVIRASKGEGSREYSWQQWQSLGQDQKSQIVDPRLNEAFGLADDSPAIALGFEPLPIARMGLQPSSERKNWPPPVANGIRETMQRELFPVGRAS